MRVGLHHLTLTLGDWKDPQVQSICVEPTSSESLLVLFSKRHLARTCGPYPIGGQFRER